MDEVKPVLAIQLEYGFHEIKKYIHSGFAQKLAEHFNIVWLLLDKGNTALENYFKATGFPIVKFSESNFAQKNFKLETQNASVRKAWMKRNHIGVFHNYQRVKTNSWKEQILGNSLLKFFLERRTLNKVNANYFNSTIEEVFIKFNVNHFFSTSYASPFAKAAFVTANKMGITTNFLVNSWKDLFTNNFVPFFFLTQLFFWDKKMKADYLDQMPYLSKSKLVISGNPTFDVLINYTPKHSIEYYNLKYSLPVNSKWIVYTMMPDSLVNNEIETVQLVANKLLDMYTCDELMLLIRKNPNHSKEEFTTINFPINCRLLEHFCTFDKVHDTIVQTQEGEEEWLDLIHYARANFSVPSTVTLEFLALSKPVFNLEFGSDGKLNSNLRQHFEAGFYKPLFENSWVFRIDELNKLDKNRLSILFKERQIENLNSHTLASDIILNELMT